MSGGMSSGSASAAPEPVRNASELRDLLRQAEVGVAGLKRASAEEAAAIVPMVDAAEKSIPRIEGQFSVVLTAERRRLEILESALRNNAALLVNRAGTKRLAQLRAVAAPGDDGWWWRLDLAVAEQRRQRVRRLAIRGGLLVLVLVVLAGAYQLFLAPSPEALGSGQHISDGESYLTQGNLEAALTEYRAALDADHANIEAYTAIAAILDQLGRGGEAQQYFAQAGAHAPDQADYYANLAMAYYRMSSQGAIDAVAKAEDAAQKAVATDGNSAVAWLALGSVYELEGQVPQAIEALDKAASLTNDAALAASIKIRVAMLSQRPYGLPTGQETTPEPSQ